MTISEKTCIACHLVQPLGVGCGVSSEAPWQGQGILGCPGASPAGVAVALPVEEEVTVTRGGGRLGG